MIERLEVNTLGMSTQAWQYGATDGQLLVLVHGFRGDHHGLEGLARAANSIAPELRIVVPDLPGFGASPTVPGRAHDLDLFGEWLCEFVAQIKEPEEGFAILGHSFGSLVVANAMYQGLSPRNTTLINPISAPAFRRPSGVDDAARDRLLSGRRFATRGTVTNTSWPQAHCAGDESVHGEDS